MTMQRIIPKTEFPIDISSTGVAAAGPAYLVGQDRAGRWLAVETHGRGGGVFATRDAAFTYARAETSRRTDAVQFAAEPIALR